MKTIDNIENLVMAGFVSVAAAGLVGCADTEPVAYNPPVKVVHEPTALNTVPPTANSTTITTQFGNGDGAEADDYRLQPWLHHGWGLHIRRRSYPQRRRSRRLARRRPSLTSDDARRLSTR